ITPARPLARIEVKSREAGVEEIGVEADNDVGVAKLVLRFNVLAESHDRAGADVVTMQGLPLMPLHLGEGLLQSTDLRRQGGRGDALGEQAQSRAAQRLLGVQRTLNGADEVHPGEHLALVEAGL